MATAAVSPPSSHSFSIPAATLPTASDVSGVEASKVVDQWLAKFHEAIGHSDFDVTKVFLSNSFWRDRLCLSWDFHCLQSPKNIQSFLKDHPKGCRIRKLAVDNSAEHRKPSIAPVDFHGNTKTVKSFLTVETDVGRGRGTVTLAPDQADGQWKAFILFTTLEELKGHEERTKSRRPLGVQHGANINRKNWSDRREDEKEFANGAEPTVFIIGAGQAGLTLAARLKLLGVSTLVIDKNARVGDSWRNRYKQLVLHDPVWYDHLPYIPFPQSWPVFTPKDKLGDWFEQYAASLELNIWTSTNITSIDWNDDKSEWTVKLERLKDGQPEQRTLHPKFAVQATGHSGEPRFPSNIPGINDFNGELCHSSKFRGAKPNGQGRKAIVVGACNSGHDIASTYYENGWDVTICQRSETYVMSSREGLDVLLKGLYEEDLELPTEDADLLFMSLPNPVLKSIHIDATKEIAHRDADLLEGLAKAGFRVGYGPQQAGFFSLYFENSGGYYIDVGASQLIADGKIKVKQGQEIAGVMPGGLKFADGSQLEADEIVFATGYSNMRETCRRIFGGKVADQVQDVWGYDNQGELRSVWRRSGKEGLFFMGGNLGLCRFNSRILALQLKAMEAGIMKKDDI